MSSNQNTIIEQRKRSIDQIQTDVFQPKRSIFTTVKDFILHPIDTLTPKQKNITTISLEIYKRNDGDDELRLIEKKKQKNSVRLLEHCDKAKEIEIMKQNVEMLIKQALSKTSVAPVLVKKAVSVVEENDFVKPNDVDDEKSVIIMEEKKKECETPLKPTESNVNENNVESN